MSLGEKLKALRTAKKMSQKDLAERIGIAKSVISFYESGDRFPSYDVLIKIARIFNVTTDYLLDVERERTVNVSVSIINFNTEGSITMTHQNRADVTTELYLYTDSQLTERYSSSITPIFTATYDELEQGTKSFWLYGRLRDDAPAGRYNGTIQFLTNIESSF